MKIKITADSACDLSAELIDRYNIGVIPLYITRDNESYRDGIDITAQKIFDDVEAGGSGYKTAAVNLHDYFDHFTAFLKEYDAVIHISLSSGISTCYQNALLVASELDGVYVVDSLNLSTAIGSLAIDAAIMAERGMDAPTIAEELRRLAVKEDVSFVIDTLEYLRIGGRCSALVALGANLLKLKPCIEVQNGKMDVGKKYRGTIDKVVPKYIKDRLEGQNDIDYSRIFITYSPYTSEKAIEAARQAIAQYGKFEEVIENVAGCTISNHCGPGTVGILFYRK